MKKGLTLTFIVAAESSNYGEGISNVSILKKMARGDGNQYTYISRQALRYNIVDQLDWDNTPVKQQGKVTQFAPAATIVDYPEIDLFGYMKTVSKDKKNKDDKTSKGSATTRSAVVRLSNAISLEPYKGDMDFLTNMGLASRQGLDNTIAQSEIHASYYTYSITIDLDLVGIDGTLNIDNSEKASRVNKLLETISYLYRDIKGRRENLAPLFVIGGIYERKNPFWENRVKLRKNALVIETLGELLNSDPAIKENTHVGILNGMFDNTESVYKTLRATTVSNVFNTLMKEVKAYYE